MSFNEHHCNWHRQVTGAVQNEWNSRRTHWKTKKIRPLPQGKFALLWQRWFRLNAAGLTKTNSSGSWTAPLAPRPSCWWFFYKKNNSITFNKTTGDCVVFGLSGRNFELKSCLIQDLIELNFNLNIRLVLKLIWTQLRQWRKARNLNFNWASIARENDFPRTHRSFSWK